MVDGRENSTANPATQLSATDESSTANEVGPLSILPICVTLLAVAAVAVAACVFYRKRQRQQAELLARQLRVTERRIDAVGSLREKKEKYAGRRSLYYPPSDVRASASEPSIVSRPVRPHYVLRAYQSPLALPPIRKVQRSMINPSACTCEYGVESSFCSACKERDEKGNKKEASSESLAVELATVPSTSSLTTVNTPSSQPAVPRTRSDTAGEAAETVRPLNPQNMGNTASNPDMTPSRHVLAWMEKSSSQPCATPLPLPPTSLNSQQASLASHISITTNEQEPPPNTPVSHSNVDDGAAEQRLSYISDAALSEKWV